VVETHAGNGYWHSYRNSCDNDDILSVPCSDTRHQRRIHSATVEWPAFAEWLRHGGRKLVTDAAFSAARDGMSEGDVRAMFGPPDFVVVGPEEFKSYSVAHMKGAGGAYFYKIGRFADIPNRITSEAFVIAFDPAGRVVYRLGFGVNDGDRLADIDSDTRSERRIAR
jgi:hypothetical protein